MKCSSVSVERESWPDITDAEEKKDTERRGERAAVLGRVGREIEGGRLAA